MGLLDFFRTRKKKKELAARSVPERLMVDLNDVDPAAINPPETRFTQEYKDFLASQGAIDRTGDRPEDGTPARGPEEAAPVCECGAEEPAPAAEEEAAPVCGCEAEEPAPAAEEEAAPVCECGAEEAAPAVEQEAVPACECEAEEVEPAAEEEAAPVCECEAEEAAPAEEPAAEDSDGFPF